MKIIINNPYRILGVYANSSIKERTANQTKLKAYLKVGKEVTFPLDLPTMMPALHRTPEIVAEAESKLNLSQQQIHFAQFWFVKLTSIDEIAFNHLTSGNEAKAVELWSKKDDVSSLQNMIVYAMIKNDWRGVIQNAEKLYTNFSRDFANLILGDNHTIQIDTLADAFLEELSNNVDVSSFVNYIANPQWKQKLGEKIVKPIIATIEAGISEAKAAKGSPEARYRAGKKLMEVAKKLLPQLQQHFPTSDMQYQMIADKLGLEILQCGIDYYNKAEEDDECTKVENAFLLQNFALSVVVGKLAKDRCKTNVNILNRIKKELPPKEVRYYDKKIKDIINILVSTKREEEGPLLRGMVTFRKKSDTTLIDQAIDLIKKTIPYLMSIKENLGANNTYYISISTVIVSISLQKVVEGFNKEMKRLQSATEQGLLNLYYSKDPFSDTKELLEKAWEATLYLDKLDMEATFKSSRYIPNRNSLKKQVQHYIDMSKSVSLDMRGENALFEECNFIRDCKKYIDLYPDGKYIDQVKRKLEKLEFDACNTIDDCKKFKSKYPYSTYQIEEKMEECCYRQSKTITDYESYLKRYPNGKYVPMAREKVEECCYKQSKTIMNYEAYLKKYPNGKYVLQAKKIIEEEKIWQACLVANKRRRYKDYLALYPNGKHKKDAELKLQNTPFRKIASFFNDFFEILIEAIGGIFAAILQILPYIIISLIVCLIAKCCD